jgi:hypothetical protein
MYLLLLGGLVAALNASLLNLQNYKGNLNNFLNRCGYITVDFATTAPQNGVCKTQQMFVMY